MSFGAHFNARQYREQEEERKRIEAEGIRIRDENIAKAEAAAAAREKAKAERQAERAKAEAEIEAKHAAALAKAGNDALEAEKHVHRMAFLEAGGSPTDFDVQWPAMKKRLISERAAEQVRNAQADYGRTFRNIWRG